MAPPQGSDRLCAQKLQEGRPPSASTMATTTTTTTTKARRQTRQRAVASLATTAAAVTVATLFAVVVSIARAEIPHDGTFAASSSAVAAVPTTAFRTAVTQDGLNYAASVFQKAASALLPSLQIPGVPFKKDGFEGSIYNIVCSNIVFGKVALGAKTGGLAGAIADVSLHCHADWKYKLHHWPHIPRGKGSVDVGVSGAGVRLTLDLATDGAGHAKVAAENVAASISHLHLHFHGGITSLLLNLFKDIFHHTIRHAVEKKLSSAVTKVVDTSVNKALQRVPTKFPLKVKAPYNVAMVDLSITSVPVVAGDYVGAGLAGVLTPLAHPNARPPYPLPVVPHMEPALANSSYVQLILASYMVESAIWTYQSSNLLNYAVTPDRVPTNFPFKLNTQDPLLLAVAPGLASAYPKDDVNLVFSVQPGANVSSSAAANAFSVSLPLSIAVQAITPTGNATAFTLGCPLSTSLSVSITDRTDPATGASNQVLTGQFKYLKCDLALESSSVGKVHFSLLKKAISFTLSDVITPLANKLLLQGMPLPVLPEMRLTHTAIHFGDNYVALGSMAEIDINEFIQNSLTAGDEDVAHSPSLSDSSPLAATPNRLRHHHGRSRL